MNNNIATLTSWARHFRRRPSLAVFGLIGVVILMSGGSLIFASGFATDGGIVATVIVTENPDGPNQSIWSDKPQLGEVAGQPYAGRVVLELWNHDGNVFYPSGPTGQNTDLLEKALLGLENSDGKTGYVDSPWTNEPVMGEYPGQTFQGRVVVEVWHSQVIVAVKGYDSSSSLVERAIEQLRGLIEAEKITGTARSNLSVGSTAEASSVLPATLERGALITGVMADSPAEQAGLQKGDVVIAVDSQQLDRDHNLAEVIDRHQVGDTVILTLERDGEAAYDMTVKLGQYPQQESQQAYLGVSYRSASQKAALNEASKSINLVSREIILEELTRLAPFEILWPQNLPDKYQFLRVMEMSERWTESSNSGIFYLEYINLNDQDWPLSEQSRLFIWQYLKTTQSLPDLDGKQPIDTLRLADGAEIPVYESEGGRSKRAFLARGQVNLELVFWGIPLDRCRADSLITGTQLIEISRRVI